MSGLTVEMKVSTYLARHVRKLIGDAQHGVVGRGGGDAPTNT